MIILDLEFYKWCKREVLQNWRLQKQINNKWQASDSRIVAKDYSTINCCWVSIYLCLLNLFIKERIKNKIWKKLLKKNCQNKNRRKKEKAQMKLKLKIKA